METKRLISPNEFYNFYQQIPDDLWGEGATTNPRGCHCAMYFLGARDENDVENNDVKKLVHYYEGGWGYIDENSYLNTLQLGRLLRDDNTLDIANAQLIIYSINDFHGNSPKENILNAIKEIM